MGESTVEVVNISAVGDLGAEVDIEQIAHDSDLPVSRYNPEYNATFLRFREDGELVILYTSGKYILRAGDEFDNMHRVNNQFLSYLNELGVELSDPSLEVKNVVAIGNLKKEINLEGLMIGLGLEQVEYEPEQFPGLVYRPVESRCVMLIFASGKVVITGGKTRDQDQDAYDQLKREIEEIFDG
jgi:transcription initiation factor TFIID TATA-box-binding protein